MLKKKKKNKKIYLPGLMSVSSKTKKRRKTDGNIKIYLESKKVINPPSRGILRYTIYVFFLCLIGFIIFILFFSSIFSLKYIDINRDDLITDSNTIRFALRSYNGKNIFFVSLEDIREKIYKEFPMIADLKIERVFPDALAVDLITHKNVANVNFIVKESTKKNEIMSKYIDDTGIDKKEEFTKGVALINSKGYILGIGKEDPNLPVIHLADYNKKIEEYDLIIPENHLNKIFEAVAILNNKTDFSLDSIEYYFYGREYHLNTIEGFSLWLDFEDYPQNQLDKLIKHLDLFDFEKDPPVYLDLRIKDRLIYY